jgi:hypothetical protein
VSSVIADPAVDRWEQQLSAPDTAEVDLPPAPNESPVTI